MEDNFSTKKVALVWEHPSFSGGKCVKCGLERPTLTFGHCPWCWKEKMTYQRQILQGKKGKKR
jgi:hypothetical protein